MLQKSQGAYLASVEDNEYHNVTVWDWARKKKIASARVRDRTVDRLRTENSHAILKSRAILKSMLV